MPAVFLVVSDNNPYICSKIKRKEELTELLGNGDAEIILE